MSQYFLQGMAVLIFAVGIIWGFKEKEPDKRSGIMAICVGAVIGTIGLLLTLLFMALNIITEREIWDVLFFVDSTIGSGDVGIMFGYAIIGWGVVVYSRGSIKSEGRSNA